MASIPEPARYTPEQYLELERKAPFKSECHNGRIYAMSGASREHNLICGNLSAELRAQLKGFPCETYIADMRVKVQASCLYTYPDVAVVCGEPRFEDAHVDTLLNPTILIEVLSPSTEAYNRGDKFAMYRKLDTLQEYILISQDKVRVERFQRRDDGWNLTEISDMDGVLPLTSIGCAVSLREIYDRIEFLDEER